MALIKGGVSGVAMDVGSTSKGAYQELVDAAGKLAGAAKTIFTLRATNFTAATTEALISLIPARDNVDSGAATSHAVTAGKRLVLLNMSMLTKNAGAAGQGVICRVRCNPAGAVTASSPIIAICGAGTNLAIANVVGPGFINISHSWPSIIEISGTAQIGISQIGTATAGNDVCLIGYEY